MIRSFGDEGTEDIYQGNNTKRARKKCPRELWSKARDLMDVLNYASELKDTERTPGARLHSLKGQRAEQHAVSINDQYRITFRWTDNGPEEVTVEDYH